MKSCLIPGSTISLICDKRFNPFDCVSLATLRFELLRFQQKRMTLRNSCRKSNAMMDNQISCCLFLAISFTFSKILGFEPGVWSTSLLQKVYFKSNLALYSLYYAAACNEFAGRISLYITPEVNTPPFVKMSQRWRAFGNTFV